jgi:predicted acylesterase/phospholipase RssA
VTGENTIANRTPAKIASKPYQILCLSGGGFRGLYTATLLEILEAEAKKPLSQVFDLIAGTSIGGILALGLATGIPAETLREAFETNGDQIFPRFRKIKGKSVFPRCPLGIFEARYPQSGLRKTIEDIFGGQSQAKLSSARTSVLVCSVDLNDRGPRIFRSSDNASEVHLLDVALATSAAPTYFPEHTIDKSLLVDGGLIANAPDMIALLEALKSEVLADIRMMSLGTAGREGARPYREAMSPGLIGSAKDTFFLTLDAQESLSIRAVSDLLRDRYIRLDIQPSAEERSKIGLDVTGLVAAETLKLMAKRTWNEIYAPNQARFRDILSRSR